MTRTSYLPLHYLASVTLVLLLLLTDASPARADAFMAVEGTVFRISDARSAAGDGNTNSNANANANAAIDQELNPVGVRFRAGLRLSELFDIEGHFSFSSDDDEDSHDQLDVRAAGAHLKAYLPVGQRSALFGLAGYSKVDFEQQVAGRLATESQSGLSWGFGLETQLSDNVDLTADYMRFVQDDGLFDQVSSVNAGLKFYF